MKIEVFKGDFIDPTNHDRHKFVEYEDTASEDLIRTNSNKLLRRYLGLYYVGRARSRDEAWKGLMGEIRLRQYPLIRNDDADSPLAH